MSCPNRDVGVPSAGLGVVAVDIVAKGALTEVPLTPLGIVRDVSALSSTARPLACAAPKAETLISRLTIVPFCVVPLSTAAGWGWSAAGAFSAGTGIIPRAEREARDDAGNWTGMGALGTLMMGDDSPDADRELIGGWVCNDVVVPAVL